MLDNSYLTELILEVGVIVKKVFLFVGTLSGGGAERAVSNISLNLNENIKREIILFGANAKLDYPYTGDTIYLDRMKPSNYLYKILSLFKRIIKIRNIKINNPHTPIISFLEYPNLINILTRNYGRTIISVRNHMSSKYKNGIKAFFWNSTIKNLYSKADQVIVVSQEIKRDLMTNYAINPDKIKVIYNSYPIESIQKLSEDSIKDEYVDIFNCPVVITSGRLNKQKGHWHLIRAFSKVKKNNSNAKLVFLGDGPLKNELKRLANDYELSEDIYFFGFQDNPFKYISKAKIFVMSSLHEGFPNSLAEAMACGVPVVSTDCLSGPGEILAPLEYAGNKISYEIDKRKYGLLSPVCDGIRYGSNDSLTPEELVMASHITTLLNDEEKAKYFSKQSLKRIENFNIKNIIKHWEDLL